MSKILITGGAGFVGSALTSRLCGNHDVTVIDNYFTGSKSNHCTGVEYIDSDVNFINDIGLPKTFDVIFHLGEYARVEQSYDDFDTVMQYNYHSFPEVLSFAKDCDAKLIYSGSSTKFSDEGKKLSPYAYTKAQNTDLLEAYAEWYGLDYATVYFYNVYGDNEIGSGKYATVIAKFLELVKGGHKTLPVTAPGNQMRNFTHIDDIVDGLILVMEKGSGPGYGIGHHKAWSMIDVVEAMGVDYQIVESKQGNRMNGAVMTLKTKQLGWEPKHNLEDYIKEKLNPDGRWNWYGAEEEDNPFDTLPDVEDLEKIVNRELKKLEQ